MTSSFLTPVVLVQEEDTQPLSEPIIKPIKEKQFAHHIKVETKKDFPPTTFTKEYALTAFSA